MALLAERFSPMGFVVVETRSDFRGFKSVPAGNRNAGQSSGVIDGPGPSIF